MIPAFDVLQGGIGKFINLIQKHHFASCSNNLFGVIRTNNEWQFLLFKTFYLFFIITYSPQLSFWVITQIIYMVLT